MIPVYIDATYRIGSPVTVCIGPPVDLSPWAGKKASSRDYSEIAAKILEAVYRLAEGSSGAWSGSD
ncbi:MAG: hypothetical protein IRY98_09915 [Alicyclobacillaceae bacterium]|nr:hypothetical protein [Alicyclobacillaceae bacterium]